MFQNRPKLIGITLGVVMVIVGSVIVIRGTPDVLTGVVIAAMGFLVIGAASVTRS